MNRTVRKGKFVARFMREFNVLEHLKRSLPEKASRRAMIRMACEAIQTRAEEISFATYGKMIPGGGK